MSRNADRAIKLILKHEGGYVDHPSDPGGATNKGITLATFRKYVKPGGTKADLRALTEAQAIVVYKRQYWDRVMGDDLPSGVDYAVADFAVNSGPSRSAKYLQAIVGVSQDGVIGPATLAAVDAMDPAQIINQLCDNRLAFMKRARHPKTKKLLWPKFGRGWQRRVDDVRSMSLAWADREQSAPSTIPSTPQPARKPDGLLTRLIDAIFAAIFGPRK